MVKNRSFVGTIGILMVGLTLVGMVARVFSQGATIKWKDPVSGDWSDPTKWDLGRVPTEADDVVIDVAGTYTVTLDTNATVASLTVGGTSGTQTFSIPSTTLTLSGGSTFGVNSVLEIGSGTLAGTGDVTVNGAVEWRGGMITGTGRFIVKGTMAISGDAYLDGRTITNNGTITLMGPATTVYMRNSASLDNESGATLDIRTDRYYGFYDQGGSGARRINNTGTIMKSAGTDIFAIWVPLDNNGVINVNSGTLSLEGGGDSSGDFEVSSGATLNFGSGTHNLMPGSSVKGAGDVSVGSITGSGGVANISGTYNVTGNTTVSGTVNFIADTSLRALNLRGSLGGSGNVTVTGTMDWSSGEITGTGAFIVNGTMNIRVGRLNGRRITNRGRVNVIAAEASLSLENEAEIDNKEGAILDIQVDSTQGFRDSGGSGTRMINNAGTITKSGGTRYFQINVPLTNRGLVQVLRGTLRTFSYTQTAAGSLEVGIGGVAVGEFGSLYAVSATLDGAFRATLVRDFRPAIGDRFQVFAFGSRSGNFASFSLPEGFRSEYVGDGLVLTVVEAGVNRPPSAPALLFPASGATVGDLPFTLRLSATDPDGDGLRFKVDLLRDGVVVRTFDQTRDSTGWDRATYASGETATLTLPIILGTYQWRAQAFDGREWGAVSETRTVTFVITELPLNELRTVSVRSGEVVRLQINAPRADNLFVTLWTMEPGFPVSASLTRETQLAHQYGPDVLLQVAAPQAGEYLLEVTAHGAGEMILRASTSLPLVRVGELFTGQIYHNDGVDWSQLDVPEGMRSLDLTVESQGNDTSLLVYRGRIGSDENWSAFQSSNPPVRLTISNPQPGRYYLEVRDHGVVEGVRVRAYSIRVAGPRLTLGIQVNAQLCRS